MATKYKRVLFKLSGEALAGGKGFGIDSEVVTKITSQIKKVVEQGGSCNSCRWWKYLAW